MSQPITIGIDFGSYSFVNDTRVITLANLDGFVPTQSSLAYVLNETQDIIYYAPSPQFMRATIDGVTIVLDDESKPTLKTDDILHIQFFYPVNEDNPIPMSIISPLEENGAVPVNIQDQHSAIIIVNFNQVHNSTTMSAGASVDDYDIVVTSATGIVVGSYIILFNPIAVRFMFAHVTGIVDTTTITLDSPLDFDFPSGTYVDVAITDMSVNGSATPQVFGLRGVGAPPGVDLEIDITRIIFSCVTDTAVDLTKFADLARLTKGLILRSRNGEYKNIFNVKDNSEIAGIMYNFDPILSTNPAQGVDGFVARLTFSGQNKMGVTIRLPVGEDLELIIQDNLTGIASFKVIAEGHIVIN